MSKRKQHLDGEVAMANQSNVVPLSEPPQATTHSKSTELLDRAIERAKRLRQQSVETYLVEQLESCESPAEKLFLLGIIENDLDLECQIWPQHKTIACGKQYRIDFAIVYPKLPAEVIHTLYHLGGDHLYPCVRFAVEVDGHDFHERTKEQARRDRQRDRDLTAEGWIVLRYTASEIYDSWRRYLVDDHPSLDFAVDLETVINRSWYSMIKTRLGR